MGGDIRVESEKGKGTKFTLTLEFPASKTRALPKEMKEADKAPISETPESGSADPEGDIRLDGVRVLMAEDNELNTEIAVEILTSAGLLLDCASDGKEAVELFCGSEPYSYSVILMDMQMPVMNGCEAAAAIRKLPRADAASVPIIAMTANAFEEDIREALGAGMNAHVSKPVNFETLKAVMRKFLAGTEEKSEPPGKPEPAPVKPDTLLYAVAPYGVNISDGLARFAGNIEAYEKVLLKFPGDKNFKLLEESICAENLDSALKAAHTLKGVAANLSMESFAEKVFQVEQALRQEDYNQALIFLQQTRELYEALTKAVAEFRRASPRRY
jgi:CheY-like chemotaxis protein